MNWKKLIDKNFKNPLYLCQVKGVKWDILINNHKNLILRVVDFPISTFIYIL